MLLAELNVRHTRRHMPTRRVALDDGYLPTSGSAFGGALLGAVIAEHVPGLDEEQLDALHRLVDAARDGLTVPRIALRYRLQTDTHGLDLSRHRITGADVAGGQPAPGPRARPPRAAGAAGDRRADGRRRAAAVGPPHRVPLRRRRDRTPGVPPRGPRGAAHVRGPARAAAVPAAVRAAPGASGARRRVARRALGAALGDGGARLALGHARRARRRAEAVPAPRPPRASRPRRRERGRGGAHRRARRRARAAPRPRRLGGHARPAG